jgi:hypothetical protein
MPSRLLVGGNIAGVYVPSGKSGIERRSVLGYRLRTTEEDALEVLEKSGQKRVDLVLCNIFKLPEGTECKQRFEKGGLFFCSGNIESCPLRK